MSWAQTVPIFEGENEEVLKTLFVERSALYQNHSPLDITTSIFSGLKDPNRAQQAAKVWGNDPAIKERIRVAVQKNSEMETPTKENAEKLLWDLARNERVEAKERISAIGKLADINGWIKKADGKGDAANDNSGDLLAALAAKLPV